MSLQRLQKILAGAGIASRRHAEEMITAGRVRVNGRTITELGVRADADKDKVEVDGVRLVAEDHVYLLMHKPRGVVSTVTDPEGRPTVTSLVTTVSARLYPVGRLDFHTGGALLLTNDGDFAAALLHPKRHVPKRYLLKCEGLMEQKDVDQWAKGVELEDGKTLPAEARMVKSEYGNTWLEVVLREGRNQQIRRMGEATGFPVIRLTRLEFAGIGITGLRPGGWRFLTVDELKTLRDTYGVPKRIRSASTETQRPTKQASRQQTSKRGGFSGERRTPEKAEPESRHQGPRSEPGRPTTRERTNAHSTPARGPRTGGRSNERSQERSAPQPEDRKRSQAGASRDRPAGRTDSRSAPARAPHEPHSSASRTSAAASRGRRTK